MSTFFPGTSYWPSTRGPTGHVVKDGDAPSIDDALSCSLHRAIRQHDWPHLQNLLQLPHVNIDERDEGFTPLLRLCEPACMSPIRHVLIERLFSLSASPLTPNRAGSTAFHLASYYADTALLQLLFTHPSSADIDLPLVESCCILAGNSCNDSRVREGQRRRVQAVLQAGWTRLVLERLLDAVPCMPTDLARIIAQQCTLDQCNSNDTDILLLSPKSPAPLNFPPAVSLPES